MSKIFDEIFSRWLSQHLKTCKGERKRRLLNGLGYSEKLFLMLVWWPAVQSLANLHPEFEVRDFKDGTRFLDFAFFLKGLKICIEIDAYNTHCRDLDRKQFADHLTRQNHLVIDGWLVLRFSLDDIKENPRSCQQLLLQALGKWGLEQQESIEASNPIDLAILKLMRTHGAPLSPSKVARELGWHRATATAHLHSLLNKGYLLPAGSGQKRIKLYRLNPDYNRKNSG
ncbi:helix-turn-helix domain-containing protein [Cohnella pontilimi]|nr:helix-turn-helix domain-containing protein [Cohnella pontilimi]